MSPDNRRHRGLDLLNFFTANVQTGFGPFIASWLTINKWTQGDIGLVLSIGTLAGMISQIPAGALLDATPFKRGIAATGILSIAICALMIGWWPHPLSVTIAELLHGFASCVIVPSVAAISLSLVGSKKFGERVGRNSRWGAIGNGAAAGVMGLMGWWLSAASVFWLTAALALPAALSLIMIGPLREPPPPASPPEHERSEWRAARRLMADRRILMFGLATILFHLSNAAMMPLAAASATENAGRSGQLIIGAAIVLPQLVVALISPFVGRAADDWGHRLVLTCGFAALPVRGLLLAALFAVPTLLPLIQSLDGISGATFGVMLPLIAADVTGGRRGFNLCVGLLGLAAGIGGVLSTTMGGFLADRFGLPLTFLALATTGFCACGMVWLGLPRKNPVSQPARHPSPVA